MGRRRGGKDSLLTAGKPRTAMLQFIIHDLLCCTTLAEQAPPVKAETKKAMSLANCAMSVLVALCSDVSSGIELKDVSQDLISVRKVVLDAISKAIRDTISSADHIDVRYGRLHSLSDLCYRLLTARASVAPKGHDDGTLHIAKIMLEKNFAVTLTNALAEIDLNYPDVKLVVTDILKPLEHLYVCFTATDFSVSLPISTDPDRRLPFDPLLGPRSRSRWVVLRTRRRTLPSRRTRRTSTTT